jgi:phosphomannomutase
MRTSSPVLFNVAKQTLLDYGAKVIDVGLLSTPSFYYAVYNYGYDAGIQITASHNPKEYNGVKFVKNGDTGLIKIGKTTGMEEIKKLVVEGVNPQKQFNGILEENNSVQEDEVRDALGLIDNMQLTPFTVVADPANAMGATYIDALFQKIPGTLIKMNFDLDGTFPVHQPDPLDFNNLKDLQKRVLEEKADFGLAPDGDGDRLFFIDDKGQVVPATIVTGIITKLLLTENPGAKILFEIRYIFTPIKIVEEYNGTYQITKVGHAYITETMEATGAIFGGESSAHYFYKSNGNAESQLTTIVYILKALTDSGKKLSELVEEYRRSFESGEFNFKVTNSAEIITALKDAYKDGELNELDGIAITYPDWRFNVRTSNTEPLLRLNVEAYDKSTMETKRDELMNKIKELEK